jgi:hypothetical protein
MRKRDKKVVGKVIPIRKKKQYMPPKPRWEDIEVDFRLDDGVGDRVERAAMAALLAIGVAGSLWLIVQLILKYV